MAWGGNSRSIILAAALICGATLGLPASAESSLDWYGDFRLRLEQDFDSQQASGESRDDRLRARIRLRAGVSYLTESRWQFGARLRTGSDDNQQSAHITIHDFDDNDTGDEDINFDRWFAQRSFDRGYVWVGRNIYPFWNQNELFWDYDATIAGVAGQVRMGKLLLTGGYFSLPVGLRDLSGEMAGLQARYDLSFDHHQLTLAAEYLDINSNPGDEDGELLLLGNGARDYQLWQLHAQLKFEFDGKPLTFGIDYVVNVEDYDNPISSFSFINRDENQGHVLAAILGDTKTQGHWLAGYYYIRIEALAVDNSYVQDDWVRWGSTNQTRSSNLKAHEFRYAYAISSNMNLVTRLFLADAITSIEDGKRIRLDFNWRF
jgi:hypothetical protein